MSLSVLNILFSVKFQKPFQTTLKTWVLLQQTPFKKEQTFSLSNNQAKDRYGYCGWKNVLTLNCLHHPLSGDRESWMQAASSRLCLSSEQLLMLQGSQAFRDTLLAQVLVFASTSNYCTPLPGHSPSLPPGTSQHQHLVHYFKHKAGRDVRSTL